MIKDVNVRFDDYSISPKIRQILLQWGYELVKSDSFFIHIKMSYYWFNAQELLEKAKDRYHNCGGKEKAAILQQKKDVLSKNQEKIIMI